MNSIQFTVPGKPQAKQRPRFTKSRRKKAYTPEETVEYEKKVKFSAIKAGCNIMLIGPIKATIKAYWPATQKRHDEFKDTKPDADNVGKAILDALNGTCYHDDSQVVDSRVIKYYAKRGEGARAEVCLEEVEG